MRVNEEVGHVEYRFCTCHNIYDFFFFPTFLKKFFFVFFFSLSMELMQCIDKLFILILLTDVSLCSWNKYLYTNFNLSHIYFIFSVQFGNNK